MKRIIIALITISCIGTFTLSAEAYVANRNTGKIHTNTCRFVPKMSGGSKVYINSLAEAKASGYTPCQRCRPF